MKKKPCIIAGVFLAVLLCAGTFRFGSAKEPDSVSTKRRTVTDMNGKVVSIPYSVNRVGSTGAVNQMVLMLGTPWKLTIVAPANKGNRWMRKVYPGIANAFAPFTGADVAIEELMKANPDAVFLIDNSGSHSVFKGISKIEEVGIPVIQVHLRTSEEMKQAVRLVGQTLGPEEQKAAEAFCADYDATLERLRSRIATLPPERRLKVYRAGGLKGLTTEGASTITSSWIETAGGVNVAAEGGVKGIGGNVSLEEIIRWDPDVIITIGAAAKKAVMTGEGWQSINAVKNGRVYANPSGVYEWSVRSAETALQTLWAAKVIHPELFADIDMPAEVRKFYKTCYRCDLSDAEISEILNPTQ